MPLKDPEARRAYNQVYGREHTRRLKKSMPPGICSVYPHCLRPTTGTNKKCDHCLAYMREYKKKYRSIKKRDGQCSGSDCVNDARPGGKLCERCLERGNAQGRKPHVRKKVAARSQIIQEEIFLQYGSKCVCCSEERVDFLSIDHIDGFDGKSPRAGAPLYRWLKRNNFPPGFRVLCMTCNYTLGHHGYCPHSDLRQNTPRLGRPRIRPDASPEVKKMRRQYMIDRYKLPAMQAYGGPVCACCGESHIECLQIDHVNGDGATHRREICGKNRSGNLYVWLRQNNYPPGFRVLCANCNFAISRLGRCPHAA